MSQLKRVPPGRTIVTIFVFSLMLVGFMTVSLSLTQAASAITNLLPRCPPETTSSNNEFCQTQPYLKCPLGQDFNLQDECAGGGQPASQPFITCPLGFQLNGGICQTPPEPGNTQNATR